MSHFFKSISLPEDDSDALPNADLDDSGILGNGLASANGVMVKALLDQVLLQEEKVPSAGEKEKDQE